MSTAISIIIPCYNQAAYIGECLESIMAQPFTDYEVIVVNDGSRDQSAAVVEEYISRYGEKIRLINQENSGVIAARNAALIAAKSRYILSLDGDDALCPDCLGTLYAAMEAGMGDVIYGGTLCFGAESRHMPCKAPTRWNMVQDNCVVCTALYRREDALKYGGYDSNMKKGLEDWEFWLNFVGDGKRFYQIPGDVLRYRILPDSRNKSFSKSDFAALLGYMRKKHKEVFRIYPLVKLRNFLYKRSVTRKGKIIIKVCKIPVWCSRVKEHTAEDAE